jgi:hypothetical protein
VSRNPPWDGFDRSNLMLSPELGSKPDLRLNSNRRGHVRFGLFASF